MTKLIVDFNAIRDGTIRALRRHASGPLDEGDRVRLIDDEEHVAEGIVERLEGDLVYVAIDWDTWRTVIQLHMQGGWWSDASTVTGQTVAAHYDFVGETVPDDVPENEAGTVPVAPA